MRADRAVARGDAMKQQKVSTTVGAICLVVVVAGLAVIATRQFASAQGQAPAADASAAVMPRYDANRNVLLPGNYRQWVLVGSSLGLSYAEPAQESHQMFNTTLMEPSAYRHFARTGAFREGTMIALVSQGVGTNATPARQGQFAADVHAVEMAVKDSTRVPEGWAYYAFGGPMAGGFLASAAPQPKANCFNCHDTHAAQDKVFTQFYGLLNEARPSNK
jgi:hypothetical protein